MSAPSPLVVVFALVCVGCTTSVPTNNGPIVCNASRPCPANMSCGFAPGCDAQSGVCQDRRCGTLPVRTQRCGCDGQTFGGGACQPGHAYRSEGPCPEAARAEDPPSDMLPANFSVGGQAVPTDSRFAGTPGCYIACYSHRAEASAYPVGGDTYVHGLVRVAGHYEGRICLPTGHETADISVPTSPFSAQCTAVIPSCRGGCWAGGDTGGFLGHN
jgi:hypothetical protein